MKITNNTRAKLEIWARESRVVGFPRASGIPRFGSRKFASATEMNAWKKELLAQIAREGGVRWTN